MPKPVAISSGPSDRSAAPSENRLVRKWKTNTAIRVSPNRLALVGCVNAMAMAIRKTATRAPHEVRVAPENATTNEMRKSTVTSSR